MPKFFVDRESIINGSVIITGGNFIHLSKALRAEAGQEIIVTDNNGVDYVCVVDEVFSGHISARVKSFEENEKEPPIKIHLFQGLPKHDKMDSIIQKSVELGVYKIYPVLTERCVAKPDKERGLKKAARWRKVAEAAAKQSLRGIIPEVSDIISFNEAVSIGQHLDITIAPYEKEKINSMKSIDFKNKKSAGIIIGPEGGFSDGEIAYCKEKNLTPVTLGKRILRTETAGICALSIALFMADAL